VPDLHGWQWALGALCAIFVGVAKTGMPGFGILVVPLMVFTVGNARASAGWLLPVLCTADVFAIAYYRRQAHARRLFELALWVVLGMAGGALALRLGDSVLRKVVGGIILLMVVAHLWRKRRAEQRVPSGWHDGAPYGVATGFATTVANAAGPVMSLYLLSQRLPKEQFVATGAWFFFLINLTKLPLYAHMGMISRASLAFDACMLPAVAVGAVLGRTVMQRLPQGVFERVVLALTTAAALLLSRDGDPRSSTRGGPM
jgi:uncharacterized membrane protein YfcA